MKKRTVSPETRAIVIAMLKSKEFKQTEIVKIAGVSLSYIGKLASQEDLVVRRRKRYLPWKIKPEDYKSQECVVLKKIKAKEKSEPKPEPVKEKVLATPALPANKRRWTPGSIPLPSKAQLMGGKCY